MNYYINKLLLLYAASATFLFSNHSTLDDIFKKAHAQCRINPIDGSNGSCMETLSDLRRALRENKKIAGINIQTAEKIHKLVNSIHEEYVDAKIENPLHVKNSKLLKGMNWLTWGIMNAGIVRVGDQFVNDTIQIKTNDGTIKKLEDIQKLEINFEKPNFSVLGNLVVPIIFGVTNRFINKSLNKIKEDMRGAHQEIKDIQAEYYGFMNPFNYEK